MRRTEIESPGEYRVAVACLLTAAVIIVVALWATACAPIPVPAQHPEPRTVALHLGSADCLVTLSQDDRQLAVLGTDATGDVPFDVTMQYDGGGNPLPGTLNLHATATCPTYQPWDARWVAATHGNQDVCAGGTNCGPNQGIVLAPLVPAIWQPTRTQVLNIAANFCGMRDGTGRVMFTDVLPGLPKADREDWYARMHAAGLTHVVISTNFLGYHGLPYPTFDYRQNPAALRAILIELLQHHFVPILMMTSGDSGTWSEITGSVWAQLWPAIQDLQPYIVFANGFETGGAWPSVQVSNTLLWMKAHFAASTIVAQEAIPERGTAASYPVQPDDPWHGDEIGMWQSAGGERVNVFLYETGHGSGLWNFAPRWDDIVSRLGAGQHTWRPMERLCFFESVAEDYIHGGVTDAQVTQITQQAKAVCDAYHVACVYGNGLP